MQWASSVESDFRNLRRAGVLKNSSRTSTVVPCARAAGDELARARVQPLRVRPRSAVRLTSASSDTDAIAASASPRKPIVVT